MSLAAAMGISAAWATWPSRESRRRSQERRDLYPEGVASGDPDPHSVLLWTRRVCPAASRSTLYVELAEDQALSKVIATTSANLSAATDWTCRVLIGNLAPARVYWYRFIDDNGYASRVGRTITAPLDSDTRPVRFAFVSCQNANLGAQHAYRRMIFEDERAPEAERLSFVLHLGDFIYELLWYPEDWPNGYYGRRPREIVRYLYGEKIDGFHIPKTVEDYRAIYRAYLHDPDLQDARARWPFICIWDNHEFSLAGWQSFESFDGETRPAQRRKVAANQAWFEYQPARVIKSGGSPLGEFDPPVVRDASIKKFDENGLGDEPNNRAALASLTGYRALRWGRRIELIITDQRSYRSEPPMVRPEASAFTSADFPEMFPQEVLEILDAGRLYNAGNAPATIHFDGKNIPNFRQTGPPQTILGAEQRQWFLKRLTQSQATWKIWGNTLGTLDGRIDPQNLPPGLTRPWPGTGYAAFQMGDFATAFLERAQIYRAVRDHEINGFVTVSGNSHSFWAGVATPSLPPQPVDAVGVAFVTGSISAPGVVEYLEHSLSPDHPLRALYFDQGSSDVTPRVMFNMLIRHGVRSCLEYQRTGSIERARKASNPDLSPHLAFLDLNGHGYATVAVTGDVLECEFVCIPRPLERINSPDGGPLSYRVVHRVSLWAHGQAPRLIRHMVEGDPSLSL